MKIIPLPQSEEKRRRKRAALHRGSVACSVAVVAFALLAILLALGLFVAVVVFEFKGGLQSTLLYILVGSFAGGAVVCALAAFGLNVLGRNHRDAELDFCERCDGEESFYVGEGTLVTFEEKGVRIHGEQEGGREIAVPYSEMRFFSVCTRRQPREKGAWSVVLEIPARYLARDGKAKADEKPALVQADAKARLYETLERHGLSLIGERQGSGEKRFTRLAAFDLPHRSKRKTALFTMLVGGVMAVGGVLVAVFWQPVLGAMLAAIGVMLAARAAFTFARAKGTLGVYEEGLFWRDTGRVDSVFLKWEEIDGITVEPNGGFALYRVQCAYGAYHFPAVEGSEEFLRETHPEKLGKE